MRPVADHAQSMGGKSCNTWPRQATYTYGLAIYSMLGLLYVNIALSIYNSEVAAETSEFVGVFQTITQRRIVKPPIVNHDHLYKDT